MTRLYCYTRAHPHRRARFQLDPFECEQIVTKVFSRMRHHRRSGALFKQLYAQHVSMVPERDASSRGSSTSNTTPQTALKGTQCPSSL